MEQRLWLHRLFVSQSLIPSSSHCHKMPRQLVKWPVTLMIKPGRVQSAGSGRSAFGSSPHKLLLSPAVGLCELMCESL